jgi:hypothetical protein
MRHSKDNRPSGDPITTNTVDDVLLSLLKRSKRFSGDTLMFVELAYCIGLRSAEQLRRMLKLDVSPDVLDALAAPLALAFPVS